MNEEELQNLAKGAYILFQQLQGLDDAMAKAGQNYSGYRAFADRYNAILEEARAILKADTTRLSTIEHLSAYDPSDEFDCKEPSKLEYQSEQIKADISILKATLQSFPGFHLPPGVDFLLVTALEEERDAVLDKLPGYQKLPPFRDDIRTYFQAQLPVTFSDGETGNYRVIVMPLLGMGRVQAATATADAITRWHPRYIMLVGIAGGVAARGVSIGDILIADQTGD